MWAYTRAAFRVQLLGETGWRVRSGELLVSTHRAETDVPLICGRVFFAGRQFASRSTRLGFAAREDMFERGFLAGFPPGLSPGARRRLYGLEAGRYLSRLHVLPIPFPAADVMRLGRALGDLPVGLPLGEAVPEAVAEELRERASELQIAAPAQVGDVLRGEFADLLWRSYPREDLDSPALSDAWRRRGERATQDIRRIVDAVRCGEPLLFFPEGRPSPDGAIGPVRPGLRLLLRRGDPSAVRFVGVAYDRITRGRPYGIVAMGPAVEPPGDGVDEAVLAGLRAATPLTGGQVIAVTLRREAAAGTGSLPAAALARELRIELDLARSEGRPFDHGLLDARRTERRLADGLRWAIDRGLVSRVEGGRTLALAAEEILTDPELAYAALEHESARAGLRAT